MKIKLLGSKGCKVCQNLEQTVINALAELGVAASLDKIDNVEEILQYNIVGLPGLIINDKVKVSGRVPSKNEVMNWINEAFC